MNKSIINYAIAILIMVIVFPFMAYSQEKEIHITTVKEVNGEKIVKDTIFNISEEENEGDIIKKFYWNSDGDSSNAFFYKFDAESDNDNSENSLIYMKGDKHKGHIFIDDEDENHWVRVIGEGDGKDIYVYKDFDFDFDFDEESIKELKIHLKNHGDHLKNLKFDLHEENIIMMEELEDIKELAELDEIISLRELKELEGLHHLEEIGDYEILMPEIHGHHNVWLHGDHYFNNVSEKELREVGIKNKPDKLTISDLDIAIDNGVVNVEFVLADDGTPKLTVFNYYGDKVFSGKPELMNGKYIIMMDLSSKQDGTYYLQIVQKNASVTKKLRL
jgi:hypothetical protein